VYAATSTAPAQWQGVELMKFRKFKLVIIILSLALYISGCAVLTTYGRFTTKGDTAKQSGRLQMAVEYYLKALQAKPSHEPALVGLEEAARDYYQVQMRSIQVMQGAEKWSVVAGQARTSLDMLKRVQVYRVGFPSVSEIQELEEILASGNQQLAAEFYSQGARSLDRQDYLGAIAQFQQCLACVRDYKDAYKLQEDAKRGLAKQFYDQGVESSQAGNWTIALDQFREVISLMPGYEDVDQRIQAAREALAEENYQKAQALMDGAGESLSVRPYREAMRYLETCLGYVPGYKDAPSKYQQAKDKAVVRVVILPFEGSPDSVGDLLTQQVITHTISQKPEMVTFVDRQYITSFLLSEMDLASTGMLNLQNATQIGQAASVHGLVGGKVFVTRTDKPEETISKTGKYRERYEDSQGNSRTLEKSYNYELHTKTREVSVQVSYQLISAETGAIIASEMLSDEKSDFGRWVRTQQKYLDFAVKEESGNLTSTKEPKSLDVLQQEAIQTLAQELAWRILSNVRLLEK